MKQRNLRFWYGIFLSVFTVALGISFIVCAADLYFAEGGYTPESAGRMLLYLLAPVILYLIAVVGGYVLSVLYPASEKRPSPTAFSSLKKLRKRIPAGEGEAFLSEERHLKNYDLTRLVLWSVSAAFAVLAATMSAVYLSNSAHFPNNNVTGEVLNMLKNVLPWVGSAFLLFVGATLYEHFAAKSALISAKKLIVLSRGASMRTAPNYLGRVEALRAPLVTTVLRVLVFALAVTFLILGIVNGGAGDVFMKAIKICTECIGLG